MTEKVFSSRDWEALGDSLSTELERILERILENERNLL